jgi:hypothetical protein
MMQQLQPGEGAPASVLARLRAQVPSRALTYTGARALAYRLAAFLLEYQAIERVPIPIAVVGDLPKIRIELDRSMPAVTSGTSLWDNANATWVIKVNAWEPTRRQRFTVLHEFFHILVHRHVERAGIFRHLKQGQIEAVADYFAGCVLVPKRELQRAWAGGEQSASRLANTFGVSAQAITVRLEQEHLTGLGREFRDIADQSEAVS